MHEKSSKTVAVLAGGSVALQPLAQDAVDDSPDFPGRNPLFPQADAVRAVARPG